MSNFGEERGEVKLPVKEWKNFRDNIYKRYNAKLSEVYNIALKVHQEMSEKKKGKRGVNLKQLFYEVIQKYSIVKTTRDYQGEHFQYMIQKSLIKDNKLLKPKKKDFTPRKAFQGETLYDDLYVHFDNKTKTITYRTDDNNHSVDRLNDFFCT